MFYAALEMNELAHHDRDQFVQRLRTTHASQTGELLERLHETRRLLFEALDDYDRRQKRTAPARRIPTPQWVDTARLLDDRTDPF